jgi:hypothetical protein
MIERIMHIVHEILFQLLNVSARMSRMTVRVILFQYLRIKQLLNS